LVKAHKLDDFKMDGDDLDEHLLELEKKIQDQLVRRSVTGAIAGAGEEDKG
jgi:hypothetical protein